MAFTPMTDPSSQTNSIVAGATSHPVFGVPDVGTVRTLVTNGWTAAQNYAANAFSSANTALASLATAASGVSTIPSIDANLTIGAAAVALDKFTEAFPTAAPVMTFTDADYSSPEFLHLLAQIDTWVQGTNTGLPPAVEQAIWDRGRAREVVASAKKSQEALRQFASRGFSKPPGALALQLQDAAQEAQNNDVTLSRDVMIKQADLEQSNRRFAFEIAEKIQASLIQYLAGKMQRALEAARTLAQLTVEVEGHAAQAYNARAGFAGALVGAEAQLQRSAADVLIATANLRVEAARSNIQSMIQKAQMLLEAIRAAAQISGQLAASALSAVNLSGGLHDSTSWGVSGSSSNSVSVSVSESASSSRVENYTP